MDIQESVLLAPCTTFEIGGPARWYVKVSTASEIHEAIEWAKKKHTRYTILAGASNVLVPDDGYDGLVVHLAHGDFAIEGEKVIADAGCNLEMVIRECAEEGLSGWESMAGIPGSLGGAVRGNAGAFGTEITDVLIDVLAFNTETGETKLFTHTECGFSYRNSFFKQHPEWIITKASIQLLRGNPNESERKIEETIAERNRRHIQDVRAAGSFFMNPVAPGAVQKQFEGEKGVKSREGRVPAGWLIEKVGLKGAQVGGAQSSSQQANYIVNKENASASDVLALAKRIESAVLTEFCIKLEREVHVLM